MVTLIQFSNKEDAKMAKQVAEMQRHGFKLREIYREDGKLFYRFIGRRNDGSRRTNQTNG